MSKDITFITAKVAKLAGIVDAVSTLDFYNNPLYSLYDPSGASIVSRSYFEKERDLHFIRYTQAQLQTILRNKYNIHVCASPWLDEADGTLLYEASVIDPADDWKIFAAGSYHTTYEAALEEGLQAAVEMVHNLKTAS